MQPAVQSVLIKHNNQTHPSHGQSCETQRELRAWHAQKLKHWVLVAAELLLWFHLMTSHHLEFMVYTGWNLMAARGCYHAWISPSNALIPAISLVCIIQGPTFIRQILTYSSAWIKMSEVYGTLDLFQALKNMWQPYSGQQSHESVSSTVNASFPKVTCWVLIARH